MKVLFDTDVLIEYLRGRPEVVIPLDELLASTASLAITPVSEAEIFRGIRSPEKQKTTRLLSSLECLSIDHEIGKRAGEYLRRYSKSHGLEIPDALIAASAVVHRFSLCTFNWKHYPMSEVERFHLDH